MSQFMTVEVDFKSKAEIIDVLDHFGLDYIEQEGGIELAGWRGSMNGQTADIAVRKSNFGGSADFGFKQKDDGTWEMVVNDMDSRDATAIQNVHLFKKAQQAAKSCGRSVEVRSGSVPQRLGRHRHQQEEIVLAIPGM